MFTHEGPLCGPALLSTHSPLKSSSFKAMKFHRPGWSALWTVLQSAGRDTENTRHLLKEDKEGISFSYSLNSGINHKCLKKIQQCWTITTTTYKCSQGRRASLCHICNWEQSRSTCTLGPNAHKVQGPASISCKGASGAKPYPDSWALPILCTLPQVILQCFRHYKADPILRACVLPKTKQLQEVASFSRWRSKAL